MKQGNIVSPGQPEQKTLKTPKTKLNEPKKKKIPTVLTLEPKKNWMLMMDFTISGDLTNVTTNSKFFCK